MRRYTINNGMILFWKSCYSQWFQSEFKDKNGLKFYNAEQFMMYHKAKLFNDVDIMEKIINEKNPRILKEYGRQVSNYIEEVWVHAREEVVILGNYYKFTQNDKILKELMSSIDKELVEASPVDRIWGIGLSEHDEKCLDKSKWRGLNLLGKCLMKVREVLKSLDIEYIIELEMKYIGVTAW